MGWGSALAVPESPRWLVKMGRRDQARRTLARIGGEAYSDAGLRDIEASLAHADGEQPRWSEVFAPAYRKVVWIGVILGVLQQWSGINVIFNYAEEIYRNAGYSVNNILFNIVITGTINLVFTFVAMATVDRLGRRPLMLLGFAGTGLIHILLGFAYFAGLKGVFVLGLTLAAIGCYAMSLAPVTWVLIAEIFPNRIRGTAVSVAVSALWIACFILTFTFPPLNRALGAAGTFWVYGGICLAGFVFLFLRVPETKNKTLEQIATEFQ
ncbi:MAG: MFS transporter [Candidatus Solibacter sp.]|nr:MFS transporter [Candidatus Solibacter sp.]